MCHKYTKKVSSPSTSEETSSTKDSDDGSDIGSDKAQEDTLGKGKKSFTRSSAKKTSLFSDPISLTHAFYFPSFGL